MSVQRLIKTLKSHESETTAGEPLRMSSKGCERFVAQVQPMRALGPGEIKDRWDVKTSSNVLFCSQNKDHLFRVSISG